MKFLEDIDLNGKKVLIRVDYNVPINNGQVIDDFRIKSSLPTIRYCLDNGASIILMSHLGRPNGSIKNNLSLDPISFYLEDLLNTEVLFSNDCISNESIELSSKLSKGEIHLLENLRFYKEEEENDNFFSKKLSKHADVYINDAFGTAHREHSSNVGILKYFDEKCVGKLVRNELDNLNTTLNAAEKPNILILGGAKIKSKIKLILNMLNNVDTILIGGAMSYAFLKVIGQNIGAHIIDKENIELATSIIEKSKKLNVNIVLPTDVVAATEMQNNVPWRVTEVTNLEEDEYGFDIGPETMMNFEMFLSNAKTITWNGPLGVTEIPIFATGTEAVSSMVRECTVNGAKSIIGGGDIAAAISKCSDYSEYTHVSTGGGASLEFMSGKKLIALKSLGIYE